MTIDEVRDALKQAQDGNYPVRVVLMNGAIHRRAYVRGFLHDGVLRVKLGDKFGNLHAYPRVIAVRDVERLEDE